ncbi:hypothetical protein BDN67DRAFT_1016619 [Paxillus ammoniavirescens]|nr:hypothetical protein BDN67DRAFT_1016619 [Paxillus ammoniavirescens]
MSYSTLMTASVHALSPIQAAAEYHKIGEGASSFEDVIALVPVDYHELLHKSLEGIMNTTDKHGHVRTTLSKWWANTAAGSLPPHLKSKVPEAQLTKGFSETADGAATRTSFIAKHVKFCADLLDDSIQAKKDELKFLDRCLTPKTQLLVLTSNKDGNLRLSGWKTDEHQSRIGLEALPDYIVYTLQIINITDARSLAAYLRDEKKKAIKKSVDMKKLAGPSKGKGKKSKGGKKKPSECPLLECTPYVPPPAHKA